MKTPFFACALAIGLAGTAQAQFASQLGTPTKGQPQVKQAATNPGVRVQQPGATVFGGGDECSSATPIAGEGNFVYDNTAATTGTDGQTEALCFAFGSSGIDNDVWFEWTADSDGMATVATCGSVDDTKIAAYDGGVCPPVAGSALACNDDFCGLQSTITFSVTNGTSYLLQVGNFPGALPTGTNAFDITINGGGGGGGADDCASPTAIMGQGSFPYDNSMATTGAEGQNETLCFAFGSSGIDNDIWFSWTADSDGNAVIDTCGSLNDTKIAAYDGVGCPAASALACNDDTCGLQSEITFPVTNGTTYTIQVGNFPGAAGGFDTLNIVINDPPTPPDCYALDDGSTENSIGLTAGGELAWLMGFDAIGGSDVITEISTAYGTAAFGGLTPGLPGRLMIWDDPTNDFEPSDCVLLWDSATTGMNEDTDILNSTPVPNIAVSGVFFIGASLDNVAGEFPAPVDESADNAGAWLVGSTLGAGTLDINNLAANDVAPLALNGIGFPGQFLLRAVGDNCGGGLGMNYCVGEANSVSMDGSSMSATGSTSIADGDLTLSASNAPSSFAVFTFSGDQADMAFGCGRRCIGGNVTRMDVIMGSGGSYDYAVPGAFFGAIGGLGTANFQCWYRDPANNGVCGDSFNLSDGLEITFTP